MKVGVGQLICLFGGVLFLSLGGGLIGGRWAVQRQGVSVSRYPSGAAQNPSESRTAEPEGAGLPALESGAALDEATVSPSTSVPSPPTEPTEPEVSILPLGDASSPLLSTRYVIQTISTSNRGDASAARNRIMAEGFPAGIFEADLGEKGRWYRVYVGPYEDEAEAQQVLESVRRIPGFKASFVKSLD